MSTVYNEQIFMNFISRYKWDPLYMVVNTRTDCLKKFVIIFSDQITIKLLRRNCCPKDAVLSHLYQFFMITSQFIPIKYIVISQTPSK